MKTDSLTAPVKVSLTPKHSRWKAAGRVLRHVLMIAFVALCLYPILWMIVSSLRPDGQIFSNPSLIPRTFHIENYTYGWNALGQPFGTFLLNSGVVVLGSIIGNLISCSFAAYAFARLNLSWTSGSDLV
ncbi:multiple sugar transport system permease protein [Ruaniaceae bacterium KH17]|nr:multiple sugar transport system permease protein [Ruaniaceae bacterium KH17]